MGAASSLLQVHMKFKLRCDLSPNSNHNLNLKLNSSFNPRLNFNPKPHPKFKCDCNLKSSEVCLKVKTLEARGKFTKGLLCRMVKVWGKL